MGDGVLILGGCQKAMDGIVALEVSLFSHFITHLLKTFTKSPGIGYLKVDVMVVGVAIVVTGCMSVKFIISLSGTELGP